MTRWLLRPSIKKLSLLRRHHGLTVRAQYQARRLGKVIVRLVRLESQLKSLPAESYAAVVDPEQMIKLRQVIGLLFLKYRSTAMIRQDELQAPIERASNYYRDGRRSIESFAASEIPLKFRFRNASQLQRLLEGFQFPETMHDSAGHKFSGEEVLLLGLYRLSTAKPLSDMEEVFGMMDRRAGQCFRLFIDFMIENWAYLLLDNMAFWVPSSWESFLFFVVFGFADKTLILQPTSCCFNVLSSYVSMAFSRF
jgi:hypothetical protein